MGELLEKKPLTKWEEFITIGSARSYSDISVTREEEGGEDSVLITTGDGALQD